MLSLKFELYRQFKDAQNNLSFLRYHGKCFFDQVSPLADLEKVSGFNALKVSLTKSGAFRARPPQSSFLVSLAAGTDGISGTLGCAT